MFKGKIYQVGCISRNLKNVNFILKIFYTREDFYFNLKKSSEKNRKKKLTRNKRRKSFLDVIIVILKEDKIEQNIDGLWQSPFTVISISLMSV